MWDMPLQPAPARIHVNSGPARHAHRVYQIAVGVRPLADVGPVETFTEARTLCLRWMSANLRGAAGKTVPAKAYAGESFREAADSAHRCRAVSLPKSGLWAGRLDHSDGKVAGRMWSADVALSRSEGGDLQFALRLLCTSPAGCLDPVPHSRPNIVNTLAREIGLIDSRHLAEKPWLLESRYDVDALHGLLSDPERTFPVVVLSGVGPLDIPGHPSGYAVDPQVLAERLLGLAHVVALPRYLGRLWEGRVGRAWAVFHGAVRVYRPGFDPSADSLRHHPRTLLDGVQWWDHNSKRGDEAFEEHLYEQTFRSCTSRMLDSRVAIFYHDARSLELKLGFEQRLAGIKSETVKLQEQKEYYESRVEALEQDQNVWRGLVTEAEVDRDATEEKLAALQEKYNELKRQNYWVDRELERVRGKIGGNDRSEKEPPIPDSFEQIDQWCKEHLSGKLVLHPRAIRAATDSRYRDYKNVPLVYQCLLALANEFRSMRLRGKDNEGDEWEATLLRLSVDCVPSITDNRAGEQGDDYNVIYPVGSRGKRRLELHLRGNSSYEPRYGLRVYFFFDEERHLVVVGYFPGHLGTRISN